MRTLRWHTVPPAATHGGNIADWYRPIQRQIYQLAVTLSLRIRTLHNNKITVLISGLHLKAYYTPLTPLGVLAVYLHFA